MILRFALVSAAFILTAFSNGNVDIIRRDSNGEFSAPGLGGTFRCQSTRDQVIFSKILITSRPLEILQVDEDRNYPLFKGQFVSFWAYCQGEASNSPSERSLHLNCREELSPGIYGETDVQLKILGDRGELLITKRGPIGRSSRWVLAGCEEVKP